MSSTAHIVKQQFKFDASKAENAVAALEQRFPDIKKSLEKNRSYKYFPALLKLNLFNQELGGYEFDLINNDTEVKRVTWNGFSANGNEIDQMRALAPFVAAGSFIEMMSSYDEHWRLVFDGKTVTKKHPKIIWD